MSTIAYATLTTKRHQAPPGRSIDKKAPGPGVNSYVDAMAALVPAEVLALHAVILSFTTKTTTVDGKAVIEITDSSTLAWSFWGLVLLCVGLFIVPRLTVSKQEPGGQINKLDWLRAVIPAAALVVWTMLQKATAFDALNAGLSDGGRTVIALFGAVVLGALARILAKQADLSTPQPTPPKPSGS